MKGAYKKFYSEKLAPAVEPIELLRKQANKDYYLIFGVLAAGFLFEVITWMLIGIVFIISFVLYYIRKAIKAENAFKKEFYPTVVRTMAEEQFEVSKIRNSRYFSFEELSSFQIPDLNPDSFEGMFLLEGAYFEKPLRLSEMRIGKGLSGQLLLAAVDLGKEAFNKSENNKEGLSKNVREMLDKVEKENSKIWYSYQNEKVLLFIPSSSYPAINDSLWKSKANPESFEECYYSFQGLLSTLRLLDSGGQ